MEIPEHRRWMYNRLLPDRVGYTTEFLKGLREFDEFAKKQLVCLEEQKYMCPCAKCKNTKYKSSEEVLVHLLRKGFVQGYWYWTCHGEVEPLTRGDNVEVGYSSTKQVDDYGSHVNHYQTMAEDVMNCEQGLVTSELPNANAQSLYPTLESLQWPLSAGCSNSHTELSDALRLMSIKVGNEVGALEAFKATHQKKDSTLFDKRLSQNDEEFTNTYNEIGLSQDTEDPSFIHTQDQLWVANNMTSNGNFYSLGPSGKHLTPEFDSSAHTEEQWLAQIVAQQQAEIERRNIIIERQKTKIEREKTELERLKQTSLRLESKLHKFLAKFGKCSKKIQKKKKKKNTGESSSNLNEQL